MIVSIYLNEHEYLTSKPQTLNFGGKYLYSYVPVDNSLLVRRVVNDKYINGFFNITLSECKIDLLSAIVGQNGVGKSSILDVIRKPFVENEYSFADNNSTIIIEDDGKTKVLYSNGPVYLVLNDKPETTDEVIARDFKLFKLIDEGLNQLTDLFEELEEVDPADYQTIYYSPHFDLKYNSFFSESDKYDISLDQYIKRDLKNNEKLGVNENGWRYELHDELVFKNSMRQIDFIQSDVFKNNSVFREVFNIPSYKTGILYFRDAEIPRFNNTPYPLRPIIELILDKLKKESADWHLYRDSIRDVDEDKKQVLVTKYLLERFLIKAFLSIVIQQMEKGNTWLEEGIINEPIFVKPLNESSSSELFKYFISESFIDFQDSKKPIFNHEVIISFLERLDTHFNKVTDPENISKQSLRIDLKELKEIIELHKEIILNLRHYYPSNDGLIDRNEYLDGFISFRPTDKNLSSGENALLNFFSKLYDFINNNLINDSKSLPDKRFYTLLLDEADLGFHPVWKKKYIDSLLKTIPVFFETLDQVPQLQIILSTHDPLTLSDLPNNNVIFLLKENGFSSVGENNNRLYKTFGANITDLLAHSFFVENGLIGDFAKSKIKEVIDWINKSKNLTLEEKSKSRFIDEYQYYRKVIKLIDENVIKIKLLEMINEVVPDLNFYNQIIDEEIKHLQSKKK